MKLLVTATFWFSILASPFFLQAEPPGQPRALKGEQSGPGMAAKAGSGPPEAAVLPWAKNVAEGLVRARRQRQPVLVRFETDSCPWCRKLEGEIAGKNVQQELSRWSLVLLDANKAEKEGSAWAVEGVPALRTLTANGVLVASHDGYLPARELIAWLKDHYQAAAAPTGPELAEEGTPDAVTVSRLLSDFRNRDPIIREAALRRLLPFPEAAAGSVVEEISRGGLQSRLAAVELLQEWKAPVAGLDPWRPETVTPSRLAVLRDWAGHAERRSGPAATMTRAQLDAARQEIERMLRADAASAAAIRERLARHGRALLPEVYARLKEAPTDSARERLTALRYRLAASQALVLDWPGGLEQLAATNADARRRAAAELAGRATVADEQLLLELFGNADPLVREIALQTLGKVAEPGAKAGLTDLLRDPEPNVRAAVLKQLAEKPPTAIAAPVAQYVAGENDPDLVVHAIRVLKGVPGKVSGECLRGLLKHPSWRVRAEAAESLGEALSPRGMAAVSDEEKADDCTALIQLLPDPDGFVVSRAVIGLEHADLAIAVAPLAAAAEAHPELASEIVKSLSSQTNMRAKAVPFVTKFFTHALPEVRAAAITGLGSLDPSAARERLPAALKDNSSAVRVAGAGVFALLLDAQRPAGNAKILTGEEWDAWLGQFHAGKKRLEWMNQCAELLSPMLSSGKLAERLAAAVPLVALGQSDKAMPVVWSILDSNPGLVNHAADVLPWLPWRKRLEVFGRLLKRKPQGAPLTTIVQELVKTHDERAAQPLWDLSARDGLTRAEIGEIYQAMLATYSVETNGFRMGRIGPLSETGRTGPLSDEQKEAQKTAKAKVRSGPDMQRVIALALLFALSRDEAARAASDLFGDPKVAGQLQKDAFLVLLLSRSAADSRKAAIGALNRPEAAIRKLAISSLILDPLSLSLIQEGSINLYSYGMIMAPEGIGGGQPIVLTPPRDLQLEQVRGLLQDSDPQAAAYAGYLMALFHDASGLDVLLRYWREHARADESWTRLVYQAAATLGDDSRVPLLEEIYHGFEPQDSAIRSFYWTIRTMEGPRALRLRKQIRHEVGMDQLR